MAEKVYLDDHGNPIAPPKVYLDDQGNPVKVAGEPDAERGGLRHPMTSMLAPELEGARSALNAATETPHGQPIMARSRTGTLYPSETGTGAVNAAKASARGAGGALISQAEGLTSPLGLATAGAAKGVSTLVNSPSARGTVGRVMQFVGNNVDITKPLKMMGKAGEWLERSSIEAPAAAEAPTGPHMDLSQPIQAGRLTPQQIGERIAAVKGAGGLPPMEPSAPKPMLGGRLRMAPTANPPITVSPESPMQAPRAEVGAEVVGRQNGMSTQQVRDTTGPIRGEAPGTAAGMPSNPKDRIVQKLIDMGPKGQGLPEAEREAYAARGTSDKTRIQVQAYLDALRKVGFVIPAGAAMPSVRDLVMQKLGGQAQE